MENKPVCVKEMAAYLGIHKDTLYRMAKRKEIPHFKVGGKILFSPSTIQQWIQAKENKN
ncbi:helix-turn-helix domain-containing protein [Virgibacillus halodenitrificans]|uniref:helix-turn-helix domain-containing protein n=1 Tax=Virgibacillus halodenitrificans TaxID=1482 RepID=UPI00076164FA